MDASRGTALALLASASLWVLAQAPAMAQAGPVETLRVVQGAASPSASSGGARGSEAGPDDRFGTAASGMPFDREVRLGANTKSVGVWRFETINFVSAGGGQFRWRFDTARSLDVFPLARIAPPGVAIPAGATVYVNGEIPIAP
jgi:hypothetical protein